MKIATGIREMASALKPFLDRGKMKGIYGVRTAHLLLLARRLQPLKEPDCFFTREGLKMKLYWLLSMDKCGYRTDAMSETAVRQRSRMHWSTIRVYKFADAIRT